jgi:predicted oxidoreductase
MDDKGTATTPLADQEPVIIIGAGLAGLTAAYEITRAGGKVIFVEQENSENIGAQAFWSLGGIFLVDTPEQRRLGVRDSPALARQDWFGSAGFDRQEDEDRWALRWVDAYLDFACSSDGKGMREYLYGLGLRFVPTVGWAERGGGHALGHGNSVPRFHVTWGTGPEVVRIFAEPVLRAEKAGLVQFRWRHRVDALLVEDGAVVGVTGTVLEPSDAARGVASSRTSAAVDPAFAVRGRAVIVASGGIGGDVELVRAMWPAARFGGYVPRHLAVGVPAHCDGRMLGIAERVGAAVVNKDRMWHYTEGVTNWDPIWPAHGIRVIPGPSSLWLDANGERLPAPLFPGCDTLAALKRILQTGHDYSWFILDKSIINKEFSVRRRPRGAGRPALTGPARSSPARSRTRT